MDNSFAGVNMKGRLILQLFIGMALLLFSTDAIFGIDFVDTEAVAGRIARSIQQMSGSHYKNLAISRIKQKNSSVSININELIDYTNVKIVRGRRFRVTDRSKLQLILKEQRIQLSEFVSPGEYKELGKVLGVQLFIYGTIYNDTLILKAIDVQTSAIAWADIFPLKSRSDQYLLLSDLSQKFIQSIGRDIETIKKERLNLVSFWDIDTINQFSSEEIMDHLAVAITKDQKLSLVDRENLQMIYQEQKLNQAVFIDESQARRLGELYGVDGFLYGGISIKPDGSYVASLKMMSIFSGVIVWADLIKFSMPERTSSPGLVNPFTKKIQQRLKKRGNSEGMVAIPGGTFIMGSNDPLYNSSPKHIVRVRSFLIDAYEVTNGDYQVFVDKKGHRRPKSWIGGKYDLALKDYPVVKISWEDAKRYCQFMGKRLPTEAEWERAIRGTEGRKYPWSGTSFSPNFANTREFGARSSLSVFTQNKDVTSEGVFHLAGNVREFVADVYRPYSGSRSSGEFQKERVVRGASWAFSAYEAAGFYRGHTRPNLAWPDVGFRCAKDL